MSNKFPVPLDDKVAVAPESPIVTSSATNCTFPVPFGVIAICPLAASVICIVPEFEPELVSKIKSYAPLVVRVAAAPPVPIIVSPVPFGLRWSPTFVSPLAPKIVGLPVAALVTSN